MMPLIDADNVADIRKMLSSQANIAAHVTNLVRLVKSKGYAGLDIDYEHMWQASDRAPFTSFVQQLATAMHAGEWSSLQWRKNPMMSTAVAVLSDQDMQDLAEYFSGQTLMRSAAKTDPKTIEQGKKIATDAQCVSCHQPNFKGLNEFPRVSRQKYAYVAKQLRDFRDGTRLSDVMGPSAQNLTDEQIEALAQYLTSL
jgi:cytochrome c553